MSDTVSGTPTDSSLPSGPAPGGGGSGGTSLGVSTTGVTAPGGASGVLPPNYASSNLGFFTRQSEPVPTAVATGPDGALSPTLQNHPPPPQITV